MGKHPTSSFHITAVAVFTWFWVPAGGVQPIIIPCFFLNYWKSIGPAQTQSRAFAI
jgi:hypothetical protein